MGKYKVNIVLTDEREINAVVSAENQAEALKRLINAEKFQEFINESGSGEEVDVQRLSVEPVEDVPINPDRYDLRPSEEKDGWWVVTDKENLFLVRFEAHRYNETAQILPIEEFPLDAQKVPTMLREVAEWLMMYHKTLLT